MFDDCEVIAPVANAGDAYETIGEANDTCETAGAAEYATAAGAIRPLALAKATAQQSNTIWNGW